MSTDQDRNELRKFLLFKCDYFNHIKILGSVYLAPATKILPGIFCHLNDIQICPGIRQSSWHDQYGESGWAGSIPALPVVIGSILTIVG